MQAGDAGWRTDLWQSPLGLRQGRLLPPGGHPAHSNSIGARQEDVMIRKLWNDESGQGLTEYALLTGAVATMIVALAALFTEELQTMLNTIGAHVNTKADALP
jgi:Flp pilus assembly pilin Flp